MPLPSSGCGVHCGFIVRVGMIYDYDRDRSWQCQRFVSQPGDPARPLPPSPNSKSDPLCVSFEEPGAGSQSPLLATSTAVGRHMKNNPRGLSPTGSVLFSLLYHEPHALPIPCTLRGGEELNQERSIDAPSVSPQPASYRIYTSPTSLDRDHWPINVSTAIPRRRRIPAF
ncbi:hypothetical protein HYDPIDRAFT_114465 [Hydnomerulius pinastri MD-312]|uniref:Uncharacterized protein n=1 Tax=Hydnomerulius pinastri MD-312 TaxID=994086 RepID=A0A0C9WCR7_9AGAM|nr:hypothetical protein HYDPIDRAFT_114465 [Hydnomerulius pinastri MD-312]